ncbi:ras association domain-containing protein 8 [Sigmodon hispidus]
MNCRSNKKMKSSCRSNLRRSGRKVTDCDSKLRDYLAQIHTMKSGLEAEKLQQKVQEAQVNEEEVKGKIEKRLQDKKQELEQLTKELRQVNLQQFIQQTGTKVTVLPAESTEVEASQADIETEAPFQSGSLKRPGSSRQIPSNLRILQNPISPGFNPEGIYV